MPESTDDLAAQILDLVRRYGDLRAEAIPFEPGVTPIPVSGKVIEGVDLRASASAVLDGWLTSGRHAMAFERAYASRLGLRHATFCNSGSSANLLAIAALTSPSLTDRALRPGDEVITTAAGFPTTLNAILQNGLVPVLVDVDPATGNVDVPSLHDALSHRTRAIFLTHTLGNPFDLDAVTAIARERNLWLVEDNCDALGAEFDGRTTGAFGDLSTCSFYPAHHITTGEGGMVATNSPMLRRLVESYRDWGRDCWCEPGEDNACGLRFEGDFGTLPHGYDHKYVYSHIGYNLKGTDMQAAIGGAQLARLDAFVAARRRNFATLRAGLVDLDDRLLPPAWHAKAKPSWFGYPVVVREDAGFGRDALVRFLEERGIGTRPMFAGNVQRHPAYAGAQMRVAGRLDGADALTERGFWVGVFPGITEVMAQYVVTAFHDFVHAEKH